MSDLGYDVDLARWLEESGRRRAVAVNTTADHSAAATAPPAGQSVAVRRLFLLAVLTVSAMQYLYADIELRIARLPTLIVFTAQP